jgi:hypothetical protein
LAKAKTVDETIKVKGLSELRRAFKSADEDFSRHLDVELKAIAAMVAAEARRLFMPFYAKTAEGFYPRLRGFGVVSVDQRRRKTTGLRPDYGALQMVEALLPAMVKMEAKVVAGLEALLDEVEARNRL